MEHATSLAQKLESVMLGKLSLESVLADSASFHGAANSCVHGLRHFLADADVRSKDDRYRAMQEAEMKKLIHLLKAGANAGELEKVTFLGPSDT